MPTKRAPSKTAMPSAKDVMVNTIKALRLDSKEAEEALAKRWGCAVNTLRAFRYRRRRPSPESNPGFYADLKKYGRAEFDERGKIISASLGKGPDEMAWFLATAPGRDQRRAESLEVA